MPIHVLPDTIASQIAAGEVVERPASVVKELIENAIDASARTIRVELRHAGKDLIQVVDDGEGIPSNELNLAVARHATSKLESAEDLFNIRTLGFRGEALASIGSVSRLTVTSKTEGEVAASRIVVDGGNIGSLEAAPGTRGTSIRVENLFFNVPARLKFLKSDLTENRAVSGLVTRYALAYPGIRWSYIQDEKIVFQTTGNGEKPEILQSLFGSQDAKLLMPVSLLDHGMEVEGYISALSLNRSNRKDITLFVNGRWIQDASLTAAVIKAYNTMLMVGRYPVVVLFLQVPTHQVDVNVHPSKAEVRFRESDMVFSTVQRAIRRGLLAYTPIPELGSLNLWGRPVEGMPGESAIQPQPALEEPARTEGPDLVTPQTAQPLLPGEHLPLLRLVGQVASTYLVAEGPDGLYLIDQHAAHERVLFDHLMAQFKAASIPSQVLLEPVIVELTGEKAALLELQLDVLHKLGFEIEQFGPNAFKLRASPAILMKSNPAQAILAVVSAFEEDETPLQAEIEARIAARVCKRMAVKSGQILTPEEQRRLLLELEVSPSPRTCPHGRPTMIHLSAALLEKQFGRSGAI